MQSVTVTLKAAVLPEKVRAASDGVVVEVF